MGLIYDVKSRVWPGLFQCFDTGGDLSRIVRKIIEYVQAVAGVHQGHPTIDPRKFGERLGGCLDVELEARATAKLHSAF